MRSICVLLLLSCVAHAKVPFTQAVALTADKGGVRWQKQGGYIVDVVIADAAGDRTVRNVAITAAGKVEVNGAVVGVTLPTALLPALRAVGAALDTFIALVAKTGKLGL